MIEIKNLNKYYGRGKNGEIHAVNDITASLPATGIVALFGKSGCGKTTFLNIVGGLDNAQSGSVELCGKRISQSADDARNRDIGYIFQNYYLTKDLTVFENVALALRLCGVNDEKEIEARTLAALRSVGMEKYRKRLPDNLSGGQQQRVAVARAIVKNPKLILADEPTGNLDENNTVLVMNLLKEISKNCLVLLVTHEADLVDLYCDTVIEMSDGQIVNTYNNENTSGYVGKNKNDIYLGDLNKTDVSGEGMELEYFGDGKNMPHRLRLICVGGVIYIKAEEGTKLRVVDSSTELKFHEGKFEEKAIPEETHLDPTLTEDLNYKKRSGRMYSFIQAFKTGYRANFGKRKFGRKALMWVMTLMAIIVVIAMAAFGKIFIAQRNLENKYNSSTVALSAASVERDELYELLKNSNYDNIYISCGSTTYNTTNDSVFIPGDNPTFSFNVGNFETFSIGSDMLVMTDSTTTTYLPIESMPQKRMLAGTNEIKRKNEVVLSRSLADAAIKSLGLEFIKNYDDLVRCSCSERSFYGGTQKYIITGVVDDNANAIYMDKSAYVSALLGNYFVSYNDTESYGKSEPRDGEIYLNNKIIWMKSIWSDPSEIERLVPGVSTITILGKEFLFVGYLNDDIDNVTEECFAVLNERDLLDLTSQYGKSDAIMEMATTKYLMIPENYAYMIHSDNPEKLASLLEETFGDENVTSPNEWFKYHSTVSNANIWGSIRTTLFCLGALALCMYFIMRSTLMKDIKDVGICRAIGVSRKNIIYKYFVESITVFLKSIVIGFIIGSLIAVLMMALSGTMLLNYTFGVAIITFILLFVVTTICGIIPVSLLLRKTPAQIISKYDI